jgi:hypothetical protein
MKRVFVNLVFAVVALAACAAAQAEERVIVIPRDNAPFTVAEDEVVRLTGKGIAGAKIAAAVEGPAKVIAENAITERVKGKPILGPGNREFEIKPTGKGTVKVTITSTPPTGDKPAVSNYEFEVK